MFFVYVLRSRTRNYIYVGITNSVERRFKQHQNGRERTTSPYKPFDLLHTETFATRQQAREREKYLKSGIGKEYLKKLKK